MREMKNYSNRKMQESEVYDEIKEAVNRLAKFQPEYGTERVNRKIGRNIALGIYYGLVDMPIDVESKRQIYEELSYVLDGTNLH